MLAHCIRNDLVFSYEVCANTGTSIVCQFVSVSECAQCQPTCFADPFQVSIQLPLNLLLSPQLEKLTPVLHSLSLFSKFAAGTFVIFSVLFCSYAFVKHTKTIQGIVVYGLTLRAEKGNFNHEMYSNCPQNLP